MNEPISRGSKNTAPRLADTSDPNSLSTRFRRRRDIRLRKLIENIANRTGSIRILDLGGSVEYWHRVGLEFLREMNAHIVVLNHLDSEFRLINNDSEIFSTIIGDACDLKQFSSNEFENWKLI